MKTSPHIFEFIFYNVKDHSEETKYLIDCIRSKYGECALRRFKEIARTTKKLIKGQCDTEFLRMCLINDLKPKFVRFKLSNRNLRTTAKVKKFRRHLLLVEYEEKQKQAKKLGKELDQMKKENHLYMFDL